MRPGAAILGADNDVVRSLAARLRPRVSCAPCKPLAQFLFSLRRAFSAYKLRVMMSKILYCCERVLLFRVTSCGRCTQSSCATKVSN